MCGYEAKARQAWLEDMRISLPANLPLAKQQVRILEKCSEGLVRFVEQQILDVVNFPNCLGNFKVELGEQPTKFKATFSAGEEQVSKVFPNLAKVHEWLLSMTISYKRGDLHKHTSSVAALTRDDVAMEKAMHTLEGKQPDVATSMQEIQVDMGIELDKGGQGDNVTDVTHDFLSVRKLCDPELKPSVLCIHKGSFNTFVKLGASTPGLCGIMLGKKAWNGKVHVTAILLSTDSVETVLTNQRLEELCERNHLIACGIMLNGSHGEWAKRIHQICRHFPLCDHPLVICADYSVDEVGDVACWEVDNTSTTEEVSDPVQLSWTTQPHEQRRRLHYTICWLADFQKSFMDDATSKICEAVVSHIQKTTAAASLGPIVHDAFHRLVTIQGDGLCGWHSMIAAADLAKYEAIPRSDSGYPLNRMMLQQQVSSAKELHIKTCNDALEHCDTKYHESIRRVLVEPAFDPLDLEWISTATGLSIRYTLAKEAHMLKNIFILFCIYICVHI